MEATEAIVHTDRIGGLFSELEARKSLLTTCTDLYKTLSAHFQTLEQTLAQRSQDLDSRIEAFESRTKETLEFLERREETIPERESAAAARVEELKGSAMSELQNPSGGRGGEFSDILKSYCRKMDVNGLGKFLLSKRKESVALRSEISVAMREAVDGHRLVIDAVEEFLKAKSGKGGLADRRWACGVLMQAVFPLAELPKGRREVSTSIMERAAEVAERWRGVIGSESGGESGIGAGEAAIFLQMVCGFGLRERFDEEFLRKLVVEHATRRDMAKIAVALGFEEKKMKDIIDELVKNGQEIEAVYFTLESGLTEQIRPATLLKSYLSTCRKNCSSLLKNSNSNAVVQEQAGILELNSCKAVIKCVEDNKLESEFTLDSLKKRVTQLEKARAEKKKSAGSTNKPSNKRGRGASSRDGGPSAFRPSKSGRFSNFAMPLSHRNLSQPHQAPAARYSAAPFNYPVQSMHESPGAAPYASGYGASHTQSPAPLPHQYPYAAQDLGPGGVRSSGSYGQPNYGGQVNYGAYEYNGGAAPAPPTHSHPPAYPQQYPQ